MRDTGAHLPAPGIGVPALMTHVRSFARHVKLSGTAEEAESLAYVEAQLRGYGFQTQMLQHDAYISLPGPASVIVDGVAIRAITQSFSRPSAPGGLTAEVVDVGAGSAADFASKQVRGRITLVDGIATPAAAIRARQAGAAGQIHVSTQSALHEMCISPVWGNPAPETLAQLPATVVCTIPLAEGVALRDRLASCTPVLATMHAEVETSWRKTPILQADMDAPDASAPFVLFSGHHDTWHYGAMDNGTANATMLELARACATQQASWRRGLRLCFWSGHSHGRFSGSAWYADEYWDELDRDCAAHVNIDSPGAAGAVVLSNTGSMCELASLAAEAVRDHAGQAFAGARMPRGADMSFSGIGIPAMFGDMSEPVASPTMPHSWWWHTPEDLLDKVDETILFRDARVCLHGLWRLLTEPVLPLQYEVYAAALIGELASLDAVLGDVCLLRPLLDGASGLKRKLEAFARDATEMVSRDRVLMQVSRALVPMAYTAGDRFSHDPALPQPPWPILQPFRALAALNRDDDAGRFALVAARRARNRLHHAIKEADTAVSAALNRQPNIAGSRPSAQTSPRP